MFAAEVWLYYRDFLIVHHTQKDLNVPVVCTKVHKLNVRQLEDASWIGPLKSYCTVPNKVYERPLAPAPLKTIEVHYLSSSHFSKGLGRVLVTMDNSTTLLAIPSTFQELLSNMDAIPKELQLPFVVAVSRYLSW